jgi:hypothetical protein
MIAALLSLNAINMSRGNSMVFLDLSQIQQIITEIHENRVGHVTNNDTFILELMCLTVGGREIPEY